MKPIWLKLQCPPLFEFAQHMASQIESTITKTRIRAPKSHGESLITPPWSEAISVWQNNHQTLKGQDFQIGNMSFGQLRISARRHLIEQATKYTSQYRDISEADPGNIVISGHQPRLFHAGVWFKNFVLSSLAQSQNATAVNLVIDNDLCGLSTVAVPQSVSPTEASTTSVAYDEPGGNLPFENRKIADTKTFNSFGDRLTRAISKTVPKPLVEQLWQNIQSHTDSYSRLGHTIAAARHKLESQCGLNTLEVPLSTVCQSSEFAIFAAEILIRIQEFQNVYNSSIHHYREIHRIRSSSHPVPELERQLEWYETPFWIWSAANPVRRAMYMSEQGNQIVLSNRGDLEIKLTVSDLATQLFELSKQNIAIRPRALITTMYSRMALADLFIHGIGGSKYDQLTDAIIKKFWNCPPPSFLTTTATMKLPFEFEHFTEQDIVQANHQLRSLQFHPEKYIAEPDEAAIELIATKQKWIKRRQNSGSSKERHEIIERCNQQLEPYVARLAEQIREQQSRIRKGLARSRILDSRGYSFCCFDKRLMNELKNLATPQS